MLWMKLFLVSGFSLLIWYLLWMYRNASPSWTVASSFVLWTCIWRTLTQQMERCAIFGFRILAFMTTYFCLVVYVGLLLICCYLFDIFRCCMSSNLTFFELSATMSTTFSWIFRWCANKWKISKASLPSHILFDDNVIMTSVTLLWVFFDLSVIWKLNANVA